MNRIVKVFHPKILYLNAIHYAETDHNILKSDLSLKSVESGNAPFVNRDPEFHNHVERLFAKLEKESRQGSLTILTERVMKYENYVQLFVQDKSQYDKRVILKIDLVNDVAAHYGTIEWDGTLGKIDSWRNILSNKVSALYRVEAKDVVDLWALAKTKSFNWAKIIREASSKEAGLDPVVLYDLLKSFPGGELSTIKWINPRPNQVIILDDLSVMAEEIFEGRENSLVPNNQ